jgi:hypothetical protein
LAIGVFANPAYIHQCLEVRKGILQVRGVGSLSSLLGLGVASCLVAERELLVSLAFLGGAWLVYGWCRGGMPVSVTLLEDGREDRAGLRYRGRVWLAWAGVEVAVEGGVILLFRRELLADVLEDVVELRVVELLPSQVDIVGTGHSTTPVSGAPGIGALAGPQAAWQPILAPLASGVLDESGLGRITCTARAADLVFKRVEEGFG